VGDYGPYTGGHGYSYNVAYSYGFAFSAADTWRRDIFAYPGGIYPYRPYGRPIYTRVFPTPDTPYISVPGPDGMPTLIKPVAPVEDPPLGCAVIPPGAAGLMAPVGPPLLQPVPATPPHTLPQPVPSAVSGSPARIRIRVPQDAEVWVEKEKVIQDGNERVFQTAPQSPGKMQIYSVRAKWHEAGREVEQFRVVGVKAGETARLTFGTPAP
jgi:uncharacterized protein (TIGR03000 family)